MNVDFAASAAPSPAGSSVAPVWRRVVGRFLARFRDRRFWSVQLLVLLATGPHYAIEMAGLGNPFATLHGLAIALYVIPLLYAALSFGWEGAILTTLWIAVLTSPSTWIWERSNFHWFNEVGQLLITLPVGLLVAWRVNLETKQRRQAEETTERLALLNDVGKMVAETLEVEQQLPSVVRRLLEGLPLDYVWLHLEPDADGNGEVMMTEPPDARSAAVAHRDRVTARRPATDAQSPPAGQQLVTVPLVGGEIGSLGFLGARVRENALTEEQMETLSTAAGQLRVAIENARLSRQRQRSMQSYIRQVTEAQEEERLRIARELHDETAQELVHLVRKLEQLRGQVGSSLEEPIDELIDAARGTIRSVRRFSQDLRPSVLDHLGLVAALDGVVAETSQSLPYGAKLKVSGQPRRVDGPVELALFRIGQEALRNVEKHAGARSAEVDLDFRKAHIRLAVKDDGHGFACPKNVSDLASNGKLGVLGMKERAQLVGGSFELRSSPGKGSQVIVRVATAEGISPL
jgi:two-component system sensor histidine kinase DegS